MPIHSLRREVVFGKIDQQGRDNFIANSLVAPPVGGAAGVNSPFANGTASHYG